MKLRFIIFCSIVLWTIIGSNEPLYAQKAHPKKKLPLIESVASGKSDFYVIFLTGDFGFRNFDKAIVRRLNTKNVSVVVLNAQNYFYSKKNPAQLGADIGSIINQYDRKWNQKQVILMGYSMGAEVLPFAVNQLEEKYRTHLRDVILIGPSQKAIFRLKPTDYLFEEKKGTDIYTELLKMKSQRSYIICDNNPASLCRKNLDGICDHDFLGGGHHFGHDYALLSNLITRRLNLE